MKPQATKILEKFFMSSDGFVTLWRFHILQRAHKHILLASYPTVFCTLTRMTTRATDQTILRPILHSDGNANSSPPTPQRRPMKRRAGIFAESTKLLHRARNLALFQQRNQDCCGCICTANCITFDMSYFSYPLVKISKVQISLFVAQCIAKG